MNRLQRDALLLLAGRGLRMLVYGCWSVVLAIYLADLAYTEAQIGLLFGLAIAAGAVTPALVPLLADRWGRRRLLAATSLILAVTGMGLAAGGPFGLLLVVAALGTLSPGGFETGPFPALEQAALAQVGRGGPAAVQAYAWYNLVGALTGAVGALVAGAVPAILMAEGWSALAAQRLLLVATAGLGLVSAGLAAALSAAVELPPAARRGAMKVGLPRSRGIVLRLCLLFAVDALAGGLVVQSFVAWWLHRRFGVGVDLLGPLFFGANLLSAFSFPVAARLAERVGLLNTMVFTHLPANVLLMLLPFMPSWPLAAGVLLVRNALSQMDVPARQAYIMAIVAPDERAAAAGLTHAARAGAAALAPLVAGMAFNVAAFALPFVLAGGLKVVYDIGLWLQFRSLRVDEEVAG